MSLNQYAVQFTVPALTAFLASYGLTTLFRRLAPRIGLTDKPDSGHKRHAASTPLMGGVAVYLAFLSAVTCWGPSAWGDELGTVLTAAGLMCLLGLADDRWALRALTKFAGQVLICLLIALGTPSPDTLQGFGVSFDLGSFAPLFVLLWLVACVNAVNLLDGLDGMVGLVGVVTCVAIAGVAGLGPASGPEAALACSLAAALLGFLMHNWSPARIFLGDAGSLTVGLLLGVLSLHAASGGPGGVRMPVALLLMGVPLLDTTLAIVRRSLTGRSIASPDRDHLHHRLRACGLSVRRAAISAAALAAAGGGAAVYAALTGREALATAAWATVVAALAASRVFGDIELRLLLGAIERRFRPVGRPANEAPAWLVWGTDGLLPSAVEAAPGPWSVTCFAQTPSGVSTTIEISHGAAAGERFDADEIIRLIRSVPSDLLDQARPFAAPRPAARPSQIPALPGMTDGPAPAPERRRPQRQAA